MLARFRHGLIPLMLAGVLAAWLPAAPAHHSFAALLDANGDDVIEVYDGTIDTYRLLNPHTALIVSVDNAGAAEDWLVEMSSLASLVREGWTDDTLSAGDAVTIAILRARAPQRGRLRAVLVHPEADRPGRLLVAYGIRGDTPVMSRLAQRLPYCGTIDGSLGRSQCFTVDTPALAALQAEFPGHMGYVLP